MATRVQIGVVEGGGSVIVFTTPRDKMFRTGSEPLIEDRRGDPYHVASRVVRPGRVIEVEVHEGEDLHIEERA